MRTIGATLSLPNPWPLSAPVLLDLAGDLTLIDFPTLLDFSPLKSPVNHSVLQQGTPPFGLAT